MHPPMPTIEAHVRAMLGNHPRHRHTRGVADTAEMLAMRYGIDPDKAIIAGLCHDICKRMPKNDMIMWARHGFDETIIRAYDPSGLHALAGRMYCQSRLSIGDEDILNAIQYHVYGRPAMSMLEKIVFVADFIEPNRAFPAGDIRQIAKNNLDHAVFETS